MNSKDITMICLFSALTVVCSLVPYTFGLIAPFCAGLMLNIKTAIYSQLVFIFFNIVGLSIFDSFKSSMMTLIGPTGGFNIGYIIIAWFISVFNKKIFFN